MHFKSNEPMKLFSSLLLLIIIPHLVNAQGSLKVTITIIEKGKYPLVGAKVTLKENTGLVKIELVSNSNGMVTTTLDVGREWNLFINGYQSQRTILVPEKGEGEMAINETYDLEFLKRLAKQIYSRKDYSIQNAQYSSTSTLAKDENIIAIEVLDKKNYPQKNKKVSLVSVVDKTLSTAVTDSNGKVKFIGKARKEYDIDVENILNIGFVDLPEIANMEVTQKIRYEAPAFTEIRKNDTISQNLHGIKNPPSGYQYVKLEVHKDGSPAKIEDVYVWDVKGTEVYHAITDLNGVAEFMIPFRKKYMVDFRYQKDVDVIDLSESRGHSTRSVLLTYVPDPRLEHPETFIPFPDQLFLKDFQTFTNKQFPKGKKVGIYARFLGKVNSNSKEAVMEIGINTNYKAFHPKMNIAFVIDNSGSMAGYDRIERLKDAMIKMIPLLSSDAIISLVTYNSVTTVVLTPQKIGTSAQKICNLLNEIQPGGGTNMLEAMKKAYGFVKVNFDPKMLNKVIIMSDGYDENQIKVLEEVQKQWPDIECSTIGIGPGFNYALLSLLAINGKGKLFYAESKKSFDSLFVNNTVSGLQAVATDVSLELEYNQKIIFKQLYGYKPVATAANPVMFKIPNLYEGSNELALVKFDLIKPDSAIENFPIIIRVKYINPENGIKEVTEEKAFLHWEPYTRQLELIADADMKKLYLIAILNQSIKVMADKFAAGKTEEARQTIQQAKEQVKTIYAEANDKDINQLMASLEEYLTAFKNLEKKEKGK